MEAITHRSFSNLTSFKSFTAETRRHYERRKLGAKSSIKCSQTLEGFTQTVMVSNSKDLLEFCRVLNGMWQTSGGWRRINRDTTVEAMLRYVDIGLITFDMADHYSEAFLHRLGLHLLNMALMTLRLLMKKLILFPQIISLFNLNLNHLEVFMILRELPTPSMSMNSLVLLSWNTTKKSRS
uniref:NADP-dependent oxidoreductase domain-containing protein n=1 Tax=Cucumis melo TaxID=3656 RepID=A0A9I9CUH4_CUCME